MSVRAPTFTHAEHIKLDRYLLKLMEAVRSGTVTPRTAAADCSQLLAAVDIGNYAEPLHRATDPDGSIAILSRQP